MKELKPSEPKTLPMQPIIIGKDKRVRFQDNALVVHLLECSKTGRRCDMNDLAVMSFPQQDSGA